MILMLLITLQSLQITIFATYAETLDILNGGNYEDFAFLDEYGYLNLNLGDTLPASSNNTPAFAHLLEEQEPVDSLTRIMNVLDVDEATAMQMVANFGSAERAVEEAILYSSLKRVYYTLNYKAVKDYLTSLVVNGYGAERVAMSYIVADVLGEDILDVMIDEYPEAEFEDEYKEVLVSIYHIDPDFIDSYVSENQIDAEKMYLILDNVFSKQFPDAQRSSTYSDSEEEEDPDLPLAPYHYQNSSNEYISPLTGDLTYRIDLASISGINGMDINLSLKYETQKAFFGDKKHSSEGGPIFEGDVCVGTYSWTNTYYEYDWENKSPFFFGAGWRLDYDYIYRDGNTLYLSLTDGSTYRITSENILSPTNGYTIHGYNSERLTFVDDEGTYNGSKYKLTFADGTVEYFDEDGNLLIRLDRYGNAITFTQSAQIVTETVNGLAITYTDQMIISNSQTSVILNWNETSERIVLPDGNIMRFSFTANDGDYCLSSYTDCEGKVTQFAYDGRELGEEDYSYTHYSGYYSSVYSETYDNPTYYLLSSVTHPTSAVSQYTYDTIRITTGIYYHMYYIVGYDEIFCDENNTYTNCPVIKSRKDIVDGADKNAVTYNYEYTSSYKYNYHLKTADFGNKVIKYQSNGKFIVKEETLVNDKIVSWVSRTYCDDIGKPLTITQATAHPNYMTILGYDGWSDDEGHEVVYPIYDTTSYISNTTTYTYDDYGYVLSETENGFTKNYTYDSNYHIPTSTSYTLDDGTLVEHNYSGNKDIEVEVVGLNETLYTLNFYTYDACGNLIREQKHTSESEYIQTDYVYDAKGRLLSETTAGVTKQYTYDNMGRMTSQTDGNGNTASYTYDSMGRITQVIYPNSTSGQPAVASTSYTVSNGINRVVETDEVGNVTTYNYDAVGNIVSVYVGNVLVERYEYDQYSRVSKKYDADGNFTAYTYDYAGRITALDLYAPNATEPFYQETYQYEVILEGSYHKTTKTVIGDTNAPDIVTVSYFDVYGRVAKEGRKVGTTELLATYTYDSRGNKISELSAQDAQNGFTSTNQYSYDYYNRVTTQTNALGESVYTEYDMLGNVIKKIDNGGNVTNITYDAFGRVTEQTTPFDTNTSTKTKYTYDGVGNVICEEVWSISGDSQTLLRKTGYVYDTRSNMLQTRSYISQDEYIVTASYTYDAKCQMLSSTSGSYTTQYEYDAYGNVSKTTYPNGTFETFIYSPNGNLLSHTDRKGVTTQYIYNPLSKPTSVTSGTSYISYTYAKSGVTLSEANNNSVTSYAYDAFGRVQIQTTNNIPVYYSYDLNDNVTSVMLAGETTSYTYDRLNRMTSAVEDYFDSDIDDNITALYTYNNLGNRTSTVTSVNGVTTSQTTYVYNLAGLATSLVNRNGEGALLSSFSYTYSADGNILTETDHLGVTTTYTYDMLGRLISEVGAHSNYYSYDISGNRTQVIVDISNVISYNYNSNGELVSETSNNGSVSETTAYEYDLNGNLTKKTKGFSVTDYTYNAWNQMVSAGNVTYTYNAQGLRVSKTSSGETNTFTLVGSDVWSDSESKYLRGIELIASDTQIYLYNIRGDVIQLLGFDGEVDKTYDYDAYGNEYSRDISDENPFRYCGEYYDTETGFIYLRARYYDPNVGRFTTVDPIKDGLNWYNYCNNNPLKHIDSSGLRPKEWADKIIKDNAIYIISAAEEFEIDPGILAATIYAEQRLNVNWIDDYIDGIAGFYGIDTSIGVGQVKISTAKFVEEEGYMPAVSAKHGGWQILLIGFIHGTEQMAREKTLEDPETNIKYVAAYLKYFLDLWENVYPDIYTRTDILATLYNLGHNKTHPHSNPEPNPFGEFAEENYSYVLKLLGIEL